MFLENLKRRATIPKHLVPRFCDLCGAPVRDYHEKDDWNAFVCCTDPRHVRRIQSPRHSFVILLAEFRYMYIVQRAVEPAVRSWEFPGDRDCFGETSKETIVRGTLHNVAVPAAGKNPEYLGEWFEQDLGITVMGFLAHISSLANMDRLVRPNELPKCQRVLFRTYDPNDLAIEGHREALRIARAIVPLAHDRP